MVLVECRILPLRYALPLPRFSHREPVKRSRAFSGGLGAAEMRRMRGNRAQDSCGAIVPLVHRMRSVISDGRYAG
jgi:hypothetical protein